MSFFFFSVNYLLSLGIELPPHVVLHVFAKLQLNETHPASSHFGLISIRNGQYQLGWKNPWVLAQQGVHHWSQQGSELGDLQLVKHGPLLPVNTGCIALAGNTVVT